MPIWKSRPAFSLNFCKIVTSIALQRLWLFWPCLSGGMQAAVFTIYRPSMLQKVSGHTHCTGSVSRLLAQT
jgi:hypothetical protein